MNRPAVLGFDTAALHCAAAIVLDGAVRFERTEAMEKGQAERLVPLLGELLSEAGLDWADVGGIGVGIGPGNFTGVRIAVAAARGLALGLGVPAWGIDAFECLRPAPATPILALVDARRGEAYARIEPVGGAIRIVSPDAFPSDLAGSGLPCVGQDSATFGRLTGGGALAPARDMAAAVAWAAAERLKAGAPAPRPAPLYVRPPDAAPRREPPPLILP